MKAGGTLGEAKSCALTIRARSALGASRSSAERDRSSAPRLALASSAIQGRNRAGSSCSRHRRSTFRPHGGAARRQRLSRRPHLQGRGPARTSCNSAKQIEPLARARAAKLQRRQASCCTSSSTERSSVSRTKVLCESNVSGPSTSCVSIVTVRLSMARRASLLGIGDDNHPAGRYRRRRPSGTPARSRRCCHRW
jgi:hypothetical protein